jgi:putative hydrolase of HD superfamily
MDHRVLVIHLTDFHLDAEPTEYENYLFLTLEQKLSSIVKNIQIEGKNILLLITGDLSHYGKDAELIHFWDKMLGLADSLKIDKERIFSCPGNHEFDRTVDEKLKKVLADIAVGKDTNGKEGITEILDSGNSEWLKKILIAYTEKYYKTLSNKLQIEPFKLPRDYAKTTVFYFESKKIPPFLITSFNSALVNFGDDPKISLGFVPDYELDVAQTDIQNIQKSEDMFRIAIYHHPLASLTSYQKDKSVAKFIKINYDISFCGHLHDVSMIINAYDDKVFEEIVGGAVYQDNDRKKKTLYCSTSLFDFDSGTVETTHYSYGPDSRVWNDTKPIRRGNPWLYRKNMSLFNKLRKWYGSNKTTNELSGFLRPGNNRQVGTLKDIEPQLKDIEPQLIFPAYSVDIDGLDKVTKNIKNEVLSYIQNSQSVLLVGDAGAGKSIISSSIRDMLNENLISHSRKSEDEEDSIYLLVKLGNTKESEEVLNILLEMNPKVIGKKINLILDAYDEYLNRIVFTHADNLVLQILEKHDKEFFNVMMLTMRTQAYSSQGRMVKELIKGIKVISLNEIILESKDIRNFMRSAVPGIFDNTDKSAIDQSIDDIINMFRNNKIPKLPIYLIMLFMIANDVNDADRRSFSVRSTFEIFLKFFISLYRRDMERLKYGNINLKTFFEKLIYYSYYIYTAERYNFNGNPNNRESQIFNFVEDFRKDFEQTDKYYDGIFSSVTEKEHYSSGGVVTKFVHESFESFSVSISLIYVLFNESYDKSKAEKLMQIILTKEITSFLKDFLNIMNEGEDDGGSRIISTLKEYEIRFVSLKEVVSRLKDLLIIPNRPNALTPQSVLAGYILGRIRGDLSKPVLEEKYKSLTSAMNQPENDYEILQFRNLCVSLMKLGDYEYEKEYFGRLFDSEGERYVNIRFHLEYYLDMPLSNWFMGSTNAEKNSENLTYQEKSINLVKQPFDKTLVKLIDIIRVSVKTGNFDAYSNLPLFTLNQILSLHISTPQEESVLNKQIVEMAGFLFHHLNLIVKFNKDRVTNKEITLKILNSNKELIGKFIESIEDKTTLMFLLLSSIDKENRNLIKLNYLDSDKLNDSFRELLEIASSKGFDKCQYDTILKIIQLMGLYKLKDLYRTGWIRRGIENPETVAEHTFSSLLILIILKYGVINKEERFDGILTLLSHDLGESIIGDLVEGDLSYTNKKEIEGKAINYISSNTDAEIISKSFQGFESHSGNSVKDICYQIDKLDPIFQTLVYLIDNKSNRTNMKEFYEKIDNEKTIRDKDLRNVYETIKKLYNSL